MEGGDDIQMVQIGDIQLSQYHYVLDTKQNQWVQAMYHSDAKQLPPSSNPPHLFSFVTTTKEVPIGKYRFADWDDIVGKRRDTFVEQYGNNSIITDSPLRNQCMVDADSSYVYRINNVMEDNSRNNGNVQKDRISNVCLGDILVSENNSVTRVGGIVHTKENKMQLLTYSYRSYYCMKDDGMDGVVLQDYDDYIDSRLRKIEGDDNNAMKFCIPV